MDLPGYRWAHRKWQQYRPNPFSAFAPPGHFYSPVPNLEQIERDRTILFDTKVTQIAGIDIQEEEQLSLVQGFSRYYPDLPFRPQPRPDFRYYFDNTWFTYGDAIALYCMMRHAPPRRVIEVGSGYSSALMLDMNAHVFDQLMQLTFIEPYPGDRLIHLMTHTDAQRCTVLAQEVQAVPLVFFADLDPGDILFIDSSHVAKIGSDVIYLLTHVLPILKAGVRVHIHDIFWPFEYPEQWIREGRAWNEAYMLKAFLQFNSTFAIRLFNSYLAAHHREAVMQALPLWALNTGGSLWLEKIK